MTTGLFSPQRSDGRSEWRVVYELAVPLDIGDMLTFDELCRALNRARHDLRPVYRAVGRAVRELRRHDSRSLASVPNVGYRVLHPKEHELQARRYQRESKRRMATSLESVWGARLPGRRGRRT